MKMRPKRIGRFVVCLSNEGYPASLETRKIYEVIADRAATRRGLLRIVDESGDDYLYPADRFAAVLMAAEARRALRSTG